MHTTAFTHTSPLLPSPLPSPNHSIENNDNQEAIVKLGGIEPLVALAKGNDPQKENAIGAMRNLSVLSENQKALVSISQAKPPANMSNY